MHKRSNIDILILPSPPTFNYPAVKNVWDYLRELCERTLIEVEDKNFCFILCANSSPCYQIRFSKGIIGKIVKNIRLIELCHHQKIDFILLYQRLLDPLSLLLATLLRKKIIFFIGASRFQIFKINLSSGLLGFLEHLSNMLNYIMLYFFQILFSYKIILVTSRFYQTEPLIRIFRSKTHIAFDIPSRSLFNKLTSRRAIFERKNIVCFVGSARLAKGFHILINVARFLYQKHYNFQFLVIGDCSKSEPKKLNDYLKLDVIKKKRNIEFSGRISQTDLINYLTDAQLLLMPSLSEGFPAVLIEAMACGTPVLATAVGAIPDMIKNSETGFLLESNDIKYVAKKVIELLNRPELLEKVSINAYNYVRENFSYEKTLEMWQKIMKEVEFRK